MATIRKHLARAFTKIAKERGWEDSKKTPHSLRRYGYKNARQWGRMMASNYFSSFHLHGVDSIITEMLEEAARNDEPITQADFDCLAEEEISCW